MGLFVHSRVVGETVPVCLSIAKFSRVTSTGCYEGPEFGGEWSGGRWSLVVYANELHDYENFVDIHLRRTEPAGDQFVEVALTVRGCPFFGLTERRQLSFTGARNSQRVMSVPKSWFHRLRFTPDDTLTVRGEMTIYEERNESFGSEDEFQGCLGTGLHRQIGAWLGAVGRAAAPRIARVLGIVLACLIGWRVAQHAFLNLFVPFVESTVLPFLQVVVPPLVILLWLAVCAFQWVTDKVEKFSTEGGRRPAQDGRALVPATNRGYRQTEKNWPGGKSYGNPRRRARMLVDFGDGNYYGCEIPYKHKYLDVRKG